MLELSDLYWLTFCGLVILWWWRSIKRREYAQFQAKQYCKRIELQWLDQNLVQKKSRFRRIGRFYWQIERYFQFEFSTTGEHRYSGYVVLLGERLSQIITDPYEKPEKDPEPPIETKSATVTRIH